MKTITHLGYTIKKAGFNWVVLTPTGQRLSEEAANIQTAKKWAEQHFAEVSSRVRFYRSQAAR